MREFTARALFFGLILTVILGAANAYLGPAGGNHHRGHLSGRRDRHGRTAHLQRLGSGRKHHANRGIDRRIRGGGRDLHLAGIPDLGRLALVRPKDAYWKSTALMVVGSILGVLFVSLVRRVMVEDPELPFPESVAASEIHKAGRRGAEAAKFLFYNIGLGALIQFLGEIQLFAPDKDFAFRSGNSAKSSVGLGAPNRALGAGGVTMASAPTVSPAYIGVGYIIGPELAALQFSGSVLAWGLMVPLLIFFLGPQLADILAGGIDRRFLVQFVGCGVALHRAARSRSAA